MNFVKGDRGQVALGGPHAWGEFLPNGHDLGGTHEHAHDMNFVAAPEGHPPEGPASKKNKCTLAPGSPDPHGPVGAFGTPDQGTTSLSDGTPPPRSAPPDSLGHRSKKKKKSGSPSELHSTGPRGTEEASGTPNQGIIRDDGTPRRNSTKRSAGATDVSKSLDDEEERNRVLEQRPGILFLDDIEKFREELGRLGHQELSKRKCKVVRDQMLNMLKPPDDEAIKTVVDNHCEILSLGNEKLREELLRRGYNVLNRTATEIKQRLREALCPTQVCALPPSRPGCHCCPHPHPVLISV